MKLNAFVKKVFEGKTGSFVNENLDNIKAAVQLSEDIGKYILGEENKNKSMVELIRGIDDKFVCSVEAEDIQKIIDSKSKGKFKLAYKLAKGFIEADGKEFAEDIFKSAMHLGIQIVVSKLFGKLN